MSCHCLLNSIEADLERIEDEVEKKASCRGAKSRRARYVCIGTVAILTQNI